MTPGLFASYVVNFADSVVAAWRARVDFYQMRNVMATLISNMKLLTAVAAVACIAALMSIAASMPTLAASTSKLAWKIVEHGPKSKSVTVDAHSDVNLMVGGKKVVIEKDIDGHYASVERGADGKYDCNGAKEIPKNALTVCSGWWAGAGETYYVVRAGHALKVYRIDVDEESQGSKKLLKRIAL